MKKDARNLCLLIYLQSYNDESKLSFLQTGQSSQFFHKILVSFFSSNIPVYIEQTTVEKLFKVLEIEFNTHTLFSLKFVFEKTKFKVLHYI